MTRHTATRRLTFCAAHRLVGHEGRCAHLHGHNYEVLVAATRDGGGVDEVGRAVDFGEIKRKLGGWIDEKWDHATILWQHDEPGFEALKAFRIAAARSNEPGLKTDPRIFFLPTNPTAENMARFLLDLSAELFDGEPFQVVAVEVRETENGRAVAVVER